MGNWKETARALAMELGAESPVSSTDAAGRPVPAQQSPGQRHDFAIYTSSGRIYIQNTAGKMIDIGDLIEEQGVYGYRLDAGSIEGQGCADLGAALRHMAGQLTFLYLNALFQRLPDSAAEASVHSVSLPAVHITLADGTDELRSVP